MTPPKITFADDLTDEAVDLIAELILDEIERQAAAVQATQEPAA